MSVVRPRGPLPARVYWTRRLLLLGIVFAIVFGIGRLVGAEEGPPRPAAQPASVSDSASSGPSAGSTADARPGGEPSPGGGKSETPLAVPTGPCQDRDVKVVPVMHENAHAGSDVRLTLRLSTFTSPACTWTVSAETVAVRLTSGSDRIWTSQECPKAVPEQRVVLRDRKATFVDVTWSGRRSDSDCSRNTLWAEPGWYHVSAAAMGSEPKSKQFELRKPAPVTITPSPTPTAEDEEKPEDEAERRPRSDRSGDGQG